MKLFISILVLAIAIGAAAAFWPHSAKKFDTEISVNEGVETRTPLATTQPTAPLATPTTPVAQPSTPASSAPTAPVTELKRVNGDQLEIDGKYTVLGSGTELDPYRITWELLKSAHETMDLNGPRDIPPKRLSMLNGTWVQISGYLAPPLWGQETIELLVMQNRWDGCCVGLPPTPFDCIEAELVTPMRLGAKHSISFGTIRGRFIVEPYRAGSFLIGLYRLESAQTDDPKDR
ncbi:MAG: hypothetical protein K8R92_06395 [Planctomycetes bacterium]|nr:hypothetical protein [Planctomycetota bacterium]